MGRKKRSTSSPYGSAQKASSSTPGNNPRAPVALTEKDSNMEVKVAENRREQVSASVPLTIAVDSDSAGLSLAGPNTSSHSRRVSPVSDVATVEVTVVADQVFDEMPNSCSDRVDSPSVSVTLGEEDTCSSGHEQPSKVSLTGQVDDVPRTSPWVNLFRDNREPYSGHTLENVAKSGNSCKFESGDLSPVSKVLGFALIGYVAGRFPGTQAIKSCCTNWKCQFSVHESGWLIFRFQDEQQMNLVLESGPYFIFQRPLLLKVMPSLFQFDNQEMHHIPVWVRLRALPFEFWNPKCLSKILSFVGKPIRTDGCTKSIERVSYARALVEINAAKELVTEVVLELPSGDSFIQEITYEYVPNFCMSCMSLGHVSKNCRYVSHTAGSSVAVQMLPSKTRGKKQSVGPPPIPIAPQNKSQPHVGSKDTSKLEQRKGANSKVTADKGKSVVAHDNCSNDVDDLENPTIDDAKELVVQKRRSQKGKAVATHDDCSNDVDGLENPIVDDVNELVGQKRKSQKKILKTRGPGPPKSQ